jgi:putative hydrolase of the HAD superfamily
MIQMLSELLNGVEVLSFDVGFTLLEPAGTFGGILARLASKHGFELDTEELNSRFLEAHQKYLSHATSRGGEGIYSCEDKSRFWWEAMAFDAFDHNLPESTRKTIASESYDTMALAESWVIYPDVVPALNALKDKGYRMIAISNWDSRLESLLESLGLSEYFEKLYISSLIGHEKPQPEIFHFVLQDLGVPPGSILHIGDHPLDDVQGPARVGIKGLAITRPNKIVADLAQTDGIQSLQELVAAGLDGTEALDRHRHHPNIPP